MTAGRAASRSRAVVRRGSRAAIALGTLGVVAAELAGGVWPVTLVTPMTRQLAAMLWLGAAGLLALRITHRERSTDANPPRDDVGMPASAGQPPRAADASTGPPMRARRPRDVVWLLIACVAGAYATFVAIGAIPWRDVPTLAWVTSRDANLGTLKILSANVHSSNLDHASLLALIGRERPDVVLLMELTSDWIDALAPLRATYPVRQVVADDAGNFGIGVWSRLPADDARLVVRQHRVEPSLDDVAHAELTLRLNGHRVRVVGVHPLPPLVPRMSAARDDLLRAIADEVAADASPTIVAGDLNATRYCRITRDVCSRAGLRDAMPGVRFSWPTTAAGFALGIKIDQILASREWRVVDAHAGPNVGSDHLPMIATLQLARDARSKVDADEDRKVSP